MLAGLPRHFNGSHVEVAYLNALVQAVARLFLPARQRRCPIQRDRVHERIGVAMREPPRLAVLAEHLGDT